MGSFSQLTYHIVFGTKHRNPTITENIQDRLYEYMGGTLRAKKGQLIEIGGISDHVHILAGLSPSIAVADVIRDVKANSSRWINEQQEIRSSFEWQIGYAAFSVSYSLRETVQKYIQNQEQHHKKKTFQEEYIELLRKHNIPLQDSVCGLTPAATS